jgi:translation initiation factor 2 beta subunit (eIF-2beta)/eIF-5
MVRIYVFIFCIPIILCSCDKSFDFKFNEKNKLYEKAVREVFNQVDTINRDDRSTQINFTLGYINKSGYDKKTIKSIVTLLETSDIYSIYLLENKYVLFMHVENGAFNIKRHYLVYNIDKHFADYFAEYKIIKTYNSDWSEIRSGSFKW